MCAIKYKSVRLRVWEREGRSVWFSPTATVYHVRREQWISANLEITFNKFTVQHTHTQSHTYRFPRIRPTKHLIALHSDRKGTEFPLCCVLCHESNAYFSTREVITQTTCHFVCYSKYSVEYYSCLYNFSYLVIVCTWIKDDLKFDNSVRLL